MNGYDFILDDLNWSFSNLKTFTQCPFEWRLKYLDAEEGIENIYGQFGTVCHKVLENFFTGYKKENIYYFVEGKLVEL